MASNNLKHEWLYTVSKISLKKINIAEYENDFAVYHKLFSPFFKRKEAKIHFYNYMKGLFGNLKRKTIKSISDQSNKSNKRALQRFISDACWAEKSLLIKFREIVCKTIGDKNAVLLIDESAFPKSGKDSIAVAKQYLWEIDQTVNCQLGIFATYVSPLGYTLIDKELFMPREWFLRSYSRRRRNCGMPVDYDFKTKLGLASELIKRLENEGIVPFKYFCANLNNGIYTDFINEFDHLSHLTYFLSIESNTKCYLAQSSRGNSLKSNEQLQNLFAESSTNHKSISAKTIALKANNGSWNKVKTFEGIYRSGEYEFVKIPIVLPGQSLKEREHLLVIKRTIEVNPKYSYFISNASRRTEMKTFAWLSSIRQISKQCLNDCKRDLGMDHYEGRKYNGWNRHVIASMLANFFLLNVNIKSNKKSHIKYGLTEELQQSKN